MLRTVRKTNIVLIGMPGVGKSTVGVLLAKVTSRGFLDTDVHIQVREGQPLQEILDKVGSEAFCSLEERHLLSINCRNSVIATGGSAVYSRAAMEHLRTDGVVVFLDIPYAELESRVLHLGSRGVVMGPGQTLTQLYEERVPVYRRYGDVRVPCGGLDHEQVVRAVLALLGEGV